MLGLAVHGVEPFVNWKRIGREAMEQLRLYAFSTAVIVVVCVIMSLMLTLFSLVTMNNSSEGFLETVRVVILSCVVGGIIVIAIPFLGLNPDPKVFLSEMYSFDGIMLLLLHLCFIGVRVITFLLLSGGLLYVSDTLSAAKANEGLLITFRLLLFDWHGLELVIAVGCLADFFDLVPDVSETANKVMAKLRKGLTVGRHPRKVARLSYVGAATCTVSLGDGSAAECSKLDTNPRATGVGQANGNGLDKPMHCALRCQLPKTLTHRIPKGQLGGILKHDCLIVDQRKNATGMKWVLSYDRGIPFIKTGQKQRAQMRFSLLRDNGLIVP